MTAVLIDPTADGLTYRVSFTYDPDVVELIKSLPQRTRRWDKQAGVWRVKASHIDRLTELLQANGCRVIGGRRRSAAAVTQWADALYAAVGPQRADQVHRALTKVLHPDAATGDNQLMQQLNVARDRMAAAR